MTRFFLLVTIIISASFGQICLKKAVEQLSELTLSSVMFNQWLLSGIFLYGFCSIAWLFVLKTTPLSQAYPFLAMTFLMVPVFSAVFLSEVLSLQYWAGSALIVVGVVLIVQQY